MRADVRSFIADELNTPRDDDDDNTDDEYGEDEEFGVECCAPLLSLTWVSCANRDTLLKGQYTRCKNGSWNKFFSFELKLA